MIILGSKSPRRKELLSKIIDDFIIISPEIDESQYDIEEVSYQKALNVALSSKDNIIITADTFITFQNQIIGKPQNELDAYEILKKLSNNTHEVTTTYCIFDQANNKLIKNKVISYVTMNDLSSELIQSYIASKSPLDKAGAYGIQDNDKFNIIKELRGSYDNVVGLPIEELSKDLISLRLKIKTT